MRFPWIRKRSYTGIITNAIEAAAGDAQSGARSAAVAAIAEYVSAELAGATIEAPSYIKITRDWLAWCGQQIVFEGEAVTLIRTRPDASTILLAVADHDWQESRDPDEDLWKARITVYAPSGSSTYKKVSRDRLVVLRWSWSTYSPGFARGPASLAGAASELAARSEARQRDHASTKVAPILPLPEGTAADSDKMAMIRRDIATSSGEPLLVETTAGGFGNKGDAPARDWKAEHLRPMPSAELNEMSRDGFYRMIAAAGVPPALFDPKSDGTALREAARQGRMRVIEPIRARLEDELRAQVDDGIRLRLDSYPLDMVSRAQVVL